jgi:hypothetical protein
MLLRSCRQVRQDIKQAETGFKAGTKQVAIQNLNSLRDYLTFRQAIRASWLGVAADPCLRHHSKLEVTNERNQVMADELSAAFQLQQRGQRAWLSRHRCTAAR